MSDIVLTASVRQNLLSLQSTADLLSRTQTRLATGNKINTALDNPNNYFTALGLNNRASDINNLLDSIGNGVQVIQAANTGISSLQKLVDTAKSIANQALQTTSGYSTKATAKFSAVTGATASNLLGDADTEAKVTGTVALDTTDDLSTVLAAGDKFTINGKQFNVVAGDGSSSGPTAAVVDNSDGTYTVNLLYYDGSASADASVQDLFDALGTATGFTIGQDADDNITIESDDVATPITLADTTSGTLAKLGLTAGTTNATNSHEGQTLTIGAIDGAAAQTITFGTGAGQVNTLDALNTKLSASNLIASIGSDGALSITTTNDEAAYKFTSGLFAGTSTTASTGLFGATPTLSDPVEDANSQNLRKSLVSQYNTIIDQIRTTAQDASYNGVNLLNGDQLKLVFNETGKSTLKIDGVVDDPAGLGLSTLTAGTDFVDNASTNKILDKLNDASSTLRTQASALGANLSVVQIRQDFSKNLINVLQSGASALTLADTNEEAANSQALSTRQSIAVSALSLANQSNQSVLRLLQ